MPGATTLGWRVAATVGVARGVASVGLALAAWTPLTVSAGALVGVWDGVNWGKEPATTAIDVAMDVAAATVSPTDWSASRRRWARS